MSMMFSRTNYVDVFNLFGNAGVTVTQDEPMRCQGRWKHRQDII